MAVVARLGLLGLRGDDLDGAVADLQRSELAVEGREHRPLPLRVGLAHRLQPGDELDAGSEGDRVLHPGPQPVQVVEGVQHRHVAVGLADLGQVLRRSGEQQPVEGPPAQRGVGPGPQRHLVVGPQQDRPLRQGPSGQGAGAERLGPPTGRVAQLAGEEPDDRVRDVERRGVLRERLGVGPDGDQVQGQVADHLGAGRHLDQPAEDAVGGGVHPLDLLEPLPQAQGDGLLAQVRQLPAGDLVVVHPPGRAGETGLEGRVDLAHHLPVRLEVLGGPQRDAGVQVGVGGGGHERRQRWLARGARHRRRRDVHGVGPRLDRGQQRRELTAGGVVGVDVDRQVEPLAQRTHQPPGGVRSQQAGHVLDRQDVGARVHDLLGQAEVVVQGVETLGGVEQVRGVAERDLGDRGPGLPDGVDRRTHLTHVVQGVEDAEDVDPGPGGLLHEGLRHPRRVRRVADRVAPAQQHLQAQVGHRLAQRREPVPRVLAQETEGDVVGRAAPALDAQQLRHAAGQVRGDGQQVGGADPGGQQRLVRVPERGVGDLGHGARAQVGRESLRPELEQALPGAGRCGDRQVRRGELERGGQLDRDLAVRLVHGDVGQERQQLGAPVRAGAGGDQVRPLGDEGGGEAPGPEVGVRDHGLQERDVGRDAADAELRERASGPGHGGREVPTAADELGEHRVEVR